MTVDNDPVQIWRPYLQQLPSHHDPSSVNLANLEDHFLNGVPRVLTRKNETHVRVTDVYDGGYRYGPSVAAYKLTLMSRKIIAGYTLSLHNQLETARVDRELRDLTSSLKRLQEDNMNDSAAVKVITFVSAIYLPGSFIVSLYGMNFFVFDEDLRQIVIAKDFWVFLATWLPLTMVTGLIYVLIVWFDAWWKRKPFRFFQRPGKEDVSEPEMQVGKEFASPYFAGLLEALWNF
ncbi:hypothetical protein AtubIFM55763_011157 [Aspergillus tubingensis]|nr:hypothetical protein AtubIFM55763_011157 [Aspergillus tubingensis]GLA97644.1 hypothetical protein AtubIFM57143_005572 [Aspergillus tubingensis]